MRLLLRTVAVAAGLAAAPAIAGCPTANQYGFAFANQAAGSLTPGTSYSYTASTSGGASQGFSVVVTHNGVSSSTVSSTTLPAISTLITGPDNTKRDLVLGGTFSARTTDITTGVRTVTAVFTFTTPVRDFAVTLHDIDYSNNQYRDWLLVTGVRASTTYTPALLTPWGNSNATGGARTNASSSITLGPSTTPMTITAQQGIGTGLSGNNADTGTVTATFAEPVTSVTVRYGNAPYTSGETTTGQQGIGIQGFTYCPMPQLSVAKTSAPVAGTLGAYNLPGQDVRYTFTVTNAGGSPVDAASIVLTDALPANVVFRNTALDASGLPFELAAGTSGVTLAAGSGAYSNNGGSTYAYAPASGYDTGVNAIRLTPAGSMAANSSFQVSFVARIK